MRRHRIKLMKHDESATGTHRIPVPPFSRRKKKNVEIESDNELVTNKMMQVY
jgi:hypothetical protein